MTKFNYQSFLNQCRDDYDGSSDSDESVAVRRKRRDSFDQLMEDYNRGSSKVGAQNRISTKSSLSQQRSRKADSLDYGFPAVIPAEMDKFDRRKLQKRQNYERNKTYSSIISIVLRRQEIKRLE
ncbi:hypothetical protein MIR68_005762 [Amoeboaphelidium protococcarum]|nr:hypothetical protein MIR68_005762 [Amoeboaphelidium protococcarum]